MTITMDLTRIKVPQSSVGSHNINMKDKIGSVGVSEDNRVWLPFGEVYLCGRALPRRIVREPP